MTASGNASMRVNSQVAALVPNVLLQITPHFANASEALLGIKTLFANQSLMNVMKTFTAPHSKPVNPIRSVSLNVPKPALISRVLQIQDAFQSNTEVSANVILDLLVILKVEPVVFKSQFMAAILTTIVQI